MWRKGVKSRQYARCVPTTMSRRQLVPDRTFREHKKMPKHYWYDHETWNVEKPLVPKIIGNRIYWWQRGHLEAGKNPKMCTYG